MFFRVLLFIISILLMIGGFTFILLYLNLFSFGYSLSEYLFFIITNIECIIFFIGFLLLVFLSFNP